MRDLPLLNNIEDWTRLADKLSACPLVIQHDSGEEMEASTLAHAFADVEGSFIEFRKHLGRLLEEDLTPEAVYDLLLEIGEEFRHILYHIRDPRFYRYLGAKDEGAERA